MADAEAGFGGPLNAFELMKSMIEAGAAGVHFEDQLASEKKCGHLGGKVLVPTSQFIRTLVAARLAADVLDVPTLLVARTDADSAQLITTDVDERDQPFLTGERTSEGFFRMKGGVEAAIARGVAYAPYADLVWMETSTPDLFQAKRFAEAVRREHPNKMLAYNCSPSFNWKKHLDDATIAQVPARARGDGLPLPVRHAGRLPQPQLLDVRARPGLLDRRHGGVFEAPAGRVRRGVPRVHGDAAPARGRHRATSTRSRR
jgi:isocitrate lyase